MNEPGMNPLPENPYLRFMSENIVNVEKMVLYIHKPQGWFDYKMITR